VPGLAGQARGQRPQGSSPEDRADSPEQSAPLPQPRCALVTSPSPILSEPSPAGETLYEPLAGSKLIISAETEHYYGLVMIDGSTGWIAKSALQLTNQTVSSQQVEVMLRGGRPDVVQEALRYLGTPYCYGGRLAGTLDCSLLVQRVFAARGTPLPRTAAAQFEAGQHVSFGQLLPGDRLYFVSSSGRVNHAGIYIGEGRFIHASSRRGCVAVDRLTDRAYWPRFLGACRS
jgi:cell wall-associated NlpC family hydrolase